MAFHRASAASKLSKYGPIALMSDQDIGLALIYMDTGGNPISTFQYDFTPPPQPETVILPPTAALTRRSSSNSLLAPTPTKQYITLKEVIACAVSLSKHINTLTEDGIIYKSLAPHTTLFNKDTSECLLLDYSQSSMLDREHVDLHTTMASMRYVYSTTGKEKD